MRRRSRRTALLQVALVSLAIAGCSSGQTQLKNWIAQVKQRPGGRIEPLPEVKPYESFTYSAANLRSPFQPQGPSDSGPSTVRPDLHRNREFLEQFPLDTLKMVGTLKMGSHFYGLVQSKDGLVHRVQPGNYVGQNDGKIVSITPSKISILEIVPDGLGGYIQRPASLALAN
ncbi:MAG: pilus assembly protein PilP [Gammaproteobacteria bacterium]|nr:pilus assembly protein PilP [Gammaproteobacteria bacterium]